MTPCSSILLQIYASRTHLGWLRLQWTYWGAKTLSLLDFCRQVHSCYSSKKQKQAASNEKLRYQSCRESQANLALLNIVASYHNLSILAYPSFSPCESKNQYQSRLRNWNRIIHMVLSYIQGKNGNLSNSIQVLLARSGMYLLWGLLSRCRLFNQFRQVLWFQLLP